MTWLLERVLDLIELITNWFYNRKYGAMVRHIGRGPAAADGQRGLIILQIDGLSYQALQEALTRGTMPCLKRLIEREGYRLQPWWCGVPSTTPAIQGGLMYGNSWNVPAFRWYDKVERRPVLTKNPWDARRIQEQLSDGRPGLLSGGSSYVNMLDGGARLALFTVSAFSGQHFFENVRGVSFAALLLFNPLRLLRIMATAVWEYLRDLWHRLVMRFDTALGRRRRPFSPISSLAQVLASIILRELQTFGILLDIYRRVPVIFSNFYGYDEVAHQLGPLNGEALRVLRGIDRRIREIDTVRRRFAFRRQYDLFVLSDHGMSPCTPFKERFGQTLGQLLVSLVAADDPSRISVSENSGSPRHSEEEARFLLAELEGLEANLSPRGQRLAAVLRDFVASRVPPESDGEWDLSRHHDLVVRNSGSLSHVYFNVTPQQMDLSEIELLYPGLLRQLVEHPGLGLVLGRENGQAMVMTIRGPRRLWPEKPSEDGLVRELLDGLSDPELAAAQLARLVCFPASGDLVILGRWDHRGHVVTFETHWATHGGLGGLQNQPFMLLPPGAPWDVSSVTDPAQLYPLFMGHRGLNGKGQLPSDEVPGRGTGESAD